MPQVICTINASFTNISVTSTILACAQQFQVQVQGTKLCFLLSLFSLFLFKKYFQSIILVYTAAKQWRKSLQPSEVKKIAECVHSKL